MTNQWLKPDYCKVSIQKHLSWGAPVHISFSKDIAPLGPELLTSFISVPRSRYRTRTHAWRLNKQATMTYQGFPWSLISWLKYNIQNIGHVVFPSIPCLFSRALEHLTTAVTVGKKTTKNYFFSELNISKIRKIFQTVDIWGKWFICQYICFTWKS